MTDENKFNIKVSGNIKDRVELQDHVAPLSAQKQARKQALIPLLTDGPSQEKNSNFLNLGLLQEFHKKKGSSMTEGNATPNNNNRNLEIDNENIFKSIIKCQPKTFYDVIANFYSVKKFMGVLNNLSSRRSPKYLNDHQFNLIGDQTFFQECIKKELDGKEKAAKPVKKANIIKSPIKRYSESKAFGKMLAYVFDRVHVFDPSTTTFLMWDFIMLFCIMSFFIIIPLEMSFGLEIQEVWKEFNSFRIFASYLMILNIMIKFNTAYYKKGIIVQQRKSIFQFYLSHSFIKDFVSVSPLIFTKYFFLINNLYITKFI